jgi:hypothetical protein
MMFNKVRRTKAAAESLLGAFGILLAGFVTIPLAADVVGAQMTAQQGAQMSIIFFGRWVWLFVLRMWFMNKERSNG